MFCICMFCGCMTTIPSTTSSPQSTTPSATQLTTQSTIPSLPQPTTQSFIKLPQPTTQSFINVQRKDNSEPLKIGTIVYYSSKQTIFSVEQVLNNKSFESDNDDTNTYYVSQMVLVNAYTYDNILERFYPDNNYIDAFIIPSERHFYSS